MGRERKNEVLAMIEELLKKARNRTLDCDEAAVIAFGLRQIIRASV
jgi:hypothetical protein